MTLQWPASTAIVDDEREIDAAAQKLMRAHRKAWMPYRETMKLLRREFPEQWGSVSECRTRWQSARIDGRTRGYEVRVASCEAKPYCPACNHKAMIKRIMDAREAIRKATPANEKPSIFGVTIAPRDLPEWRQVVRADHRAYMRACYRFLERMYGKNIGAIATYQEWGEAHFVRSHPHVHVTVDNWNIEDGKPKKVAYFDVAKAGGIDVVKKMLVEEMERAYGTSPGFQLEHFNVKLEHVAVGEEEFWKWLKYQLRELLDPLKWTPTEGGLEVSNYRDPHARVAVPRAVLHDGLRDYASRFGRWNVRGKRTLDARYGILSDRNINDTADTMGYRGKHREACRCRECVTRGRAIYADETYEDGSLENEVGREW